MLGGLQNSHQIYKKKKKERKLHLVFKAINYYLKIAYI